jgi:hypothetical protein
MLVGVKEFILEAMLCLLADVKGQPTVTSVCDSFSSIHEWWLGQNCWYAKGIHNFFRCNGLVKQFSSFANISL